MKIKKHIVIGIIIASLLSLIVNSSPNNITEAFFLMSENITITGNLTWFGYMNCTNITGNFIITTMTVGEEEVEGILEHTIEMKSYDGDFNKLKLNTSFFEPEIRTARFIASRSFMNKSLCRRLHMGTTAKANPKYRWYNSESPLIFKPLSAYYCVKTLDEINYCT